MYFKNYFLYILIVGSLWGCTTRSGKIDTEQPKGLKNPQNLNGTLTINGAHSLYPLVQQWAKDFMSFHPGVTVHVEKNGTADGFSLLLQQSHGLAMSSRSLTIGEEESGLWKIPVAKDAVVPIINSQNPYIEQISLRGLKAEQLIRIFTKAETIYWGDLLEIETADPVTVLTREEGSGTAEIWANFLWMSAEGLKGQKMNGDEEMIREIQGNPLAIGYGNLVYVFDAETGILTDKIKILPIDFNQNGRIDHKECPCDSLMKIQRAIWIGKYPRHLCRTLYLVSQGKPTGEVTVAFINWILSEGQEQVKKMGYCNLNHTQINYALQMLND